MTGAVSYTLAQREAHAESHILIMAGLGEMEKTISWRVCQTYGVPHLVDHIKAIKSRLRNELSFGEGK